SYDDNEPDVIVSFQSSGGIAANRFKTPGENLSLESISFWSGSADYTARIHVYGSSASGLPSTNFITPVDTLVSNERSWVKVVLPQPLSLAKGTEIFAAVEVLAPDKGIGYDSRQLPVQQSYLQLGGGWNLLDNFGDFPGNWMIRAVFSGLVQAGQGGTVADALLLDQNYPNPFVPAATGTHIRFQIPGPGSVRLLIYNTLGQKVADIRQENPQFPYRIFWDGGGINHQLPAGIYFYRLTFSDAVTGKSRGTPFHKMIILN
ncbi:MAG: T9SS type A sorting domain-containing protein, partial [Calditrichia bacterium]